MGHTTEFPSRQTVAEIVAGHDLNPDQTAQNFAAISSPVLIACSGGGDSIALALIAYAKNSDFALAYVDHGLSDAMSDCEQHVKNLAYRLKVDFLIDHLGMAQRGLDVSNIESQARRLRYESLEKLRAQYGAIDIATAHHSDDVAETLLINLVRGSGSGGASLSSRRGNLVRPLLGWRKDSLRDLVFACGLEPFEDPSNGDSRFVRNRMRNEVLPLLNDVAGRDVTGLLARSSRSLAADNIYLTTYASQQWPGEHASTKDLVALDDVIQVHALRAWITGYPPSHEEMGRILDVAHHRIARTQISGHRTIWRTGSVMYQDVTPSFDQQQ